MLSKLPFLKVKNVTRNFFEEKYPLGCPDFPLTVCQGIHYRLKLYQNAVDWIGCYMSETIPPPGSQIMERSTMPNIYLLISLPETERRDDDTK
jgi:hypothetical protein